MKPLRILFLTIAIVMVVPFAYGQGVAIGQWKDYLSYRQCYKVCQGKNIIYCSCPSGIFSYNTSDNSLEKYNKVTGLSDMGVSVVRYTSYNNTVFIGYSDGNMDLMQNGMIVNIPFLKTSLVQGGKTINDACFSGNYAFIACAQGILQIDLSMDVIANTCKFGPNNSAINTLSVTIFNDSIFAATSKGIYKAYQYDGDLEDYNHWTKIIDPLLTTGKNPAVYNAIAAVGNTLYVNYSKFMSLGVYFQDTMYSYTGGKWSHYSYVQGDNFVKELESSNGYLVVSCNTDVKVINSSASLVKDIVYGPGVSLIPNDAIVDGNLNVWVADIFNALIESTANGVQSIYPPGPFTNDVSSITVNNNNLWITPGGYDLSYQGLSIHAFGVSLYYKGIWNQLLDIGDSIFDINCLAVDPGNPAHAFAGSWQNGVVEYNAPNTVTKTYNPGNSSLQNVYDPQAPSYYSVRNGGVAYDTLGNLWVSNDITKSKYLSVKKTDGTWQAFDFAGIPGVGEAAYATQVLVTQSGAKWIVLPGTGILVYQDNGTFAAPNASNSILITSEVGKGALPDINVQAMAQDQNGTIWVGTDIQVVAFYSPDNVLDGNKDWDASNIYVIQNGYTQYLMQNQSTTSIAIDGADRKWIGTTGGGAFLMSADGTQQINNFTTSNSPLFSNNIVCITVNPSNGEVIFGTDNGILSYRGTATEGTSTFGNVYAFPNPVPHDYNGNVAITGLVTNADVKITDVSGELVYHTTALGGQALWNCNNFNGQRAKTGVYIVFCASPDGLQTHVTKLLLIN